MNFMPISFMETAVVPIPFTYNLTYDAIYDATYPVTGGGIRTNTSIQFKCFGNLFPETGVVIPNTNPDPFGPNVPSISTISGQLSNVCCGDVLNIYSLTNAYGVYDRSSDAYAIGYRGVMYIYDKDLNLIRTDVVYDNSSHLIQNPQTGTFLTSTQTIGFANAHVPEGGFLYINILAIFSRNDINPSYPPLPPIIDTKKWGYNNTKFGQNADYWGSYSPIQPTPSVTPSITPTPTLTPTGTPSITPTPTPTPRPVTFTTNYSINYLNSTCTKNVTLIQLNGGGSCGTTLPNISSTFGGSSTATITNYCNGSRVITISRKAAYTSKAGCCNNGTPCNSISTSTATLTINGVLIQTKSPTTPIQLNTTGITTTISFNSVNLNGGDNVVINWNES